jgi:hypothetical protein
MRPRSAAKADGDDALGRLRSSHDSERRERECVEEPRRRIGHRRQSTKPY